MKLDQADQLLIEERVAPQDRGRCRRCAARAPDTVAALVEDQWCVLARVLMCATCGYPVRATTVRDLCMSRRRSLRGALARHRVR